VCIKQTQQATTRECLAQVVTLGLYQQLQAARATNNPAIWKGLLQ
jgi:hypothetical protein